MTAPSKLLITGRPVAEILRELDKIKVWQAGTDMEVQVTGNDGSYFFDSIENIGWSILNNHESYIRKNLLKKGKILKTDGECNLWIVDDPFISNDAKEITARDDSDRYSEPTRTKFRRNSNYTKPKKRRRK